MATLTERAIERFVRYITLGELPARAQTAELRANNLLWRANEHVSGERMPTFYSYGMHFPLARFIPSKPGRSALWVINGDVWRQTGWSSTNEHQTITRASIAQAIADAEKKGKKIGSVVIPMSALDGAGIDYASIRPYEVRDDWRERFTNTVYVPRACVDMTLPSRESCEASYPGGAILNTDVLAHSRAYSVRRISETTGLADSWQVTGELTRQTCFRGYDYSDGLGKFVDYQPPKVSLYLAGMAITVDTSTVLDVDGRECYAATFDTSRHWLGDCVFSAKVARVRRLHAKRYRFVSSFDYNEPRPLYYLAALPSWSRAETVDDAVRDLAPASVHAAIAAGLDVLRQGDIFAVPTTIDDKTLAALGATRVRLTMWTRGARAKKGELGYAVPATPKQVAAFKARRRALVRAAMRANMARDTRPTTPQGYRAERRAIVAAIENAKTAPVPGHLTDNSYAIGLAVDALAAFDKTGRTIARAIGYCSRMPLSQKYGKCYSRALAAWRHATDVELDKITPRRDPQAIRAALAVYGTGHTATHVATLPSGATYVKGTMRHVPEVAGENRTADHRPIKLGDGETWHLAIRNTVPRQ